MTFLQFARLPVLLFVGFGIEADWVLLLEEVDFGLAQFELLLVDCVVQRSFDFLFLSIEGRDVFCYLGGFGGFHAVDHAMHVELSDLGFADGFHFTLPDI